MKHERKPRFSVLNPVYGSLAGASAREVATSSRIARGACWAACTWEDKEALFAADPERARWAQRNPHAPLRSSSTPRADKLETPRFAIGDRVRVIADDREGVVEEIAEGVAVRHYVVGFVDEDADMFREVELEAVDAPESASRVRSVATARLGSRQQSAHPAKMPKRRGPPLTGPVKTWSEMTAIERQRLQQRDPWVARLLKTQPSASACAPQDDTGSTAT